jgi:hypothetical protein
MKPHIRLHYTGPLGGWYARVYVAGQPYFHGFKTIYYQDSQLPWMYRDLAIFTWSIGQ